MLKNTDLFGLAPIINQPRNHDGTYAPKCDGKPQDQVRRHLKAGLKITVQMCIRLYKTTELRRIISRLRKQGMNIVSEPFTGDGTRVLYHIYSLKKEEK